MNYSPKNLESYKLVGVSTDHVDAIRASSYPQQCWNLLWLSLPDIDKVPGSGPNWWRHFQLPAGALSTIIVDVRDDDLLRSKLLMPPLIFRAWFEREDHSIFDTYDTLHGQSWVETVLRRAHEAHAHIEALAPQREGNVIKVQFGKRA